MLRKSNGLPAFGLILLLFTTPSLINPSRTNTPPNKFVFKRGTNISHWLSQSNKRGMDSKVGNENTSPLVTHTYWERESPGDWYIGQVLEKLFLVIRLYKDRLVRVLNDWHLRSDRLTSSGYELLGNKVVSHSASKVVPCLYSVFLVLDLALKKPPFIGMHSSFMRSRTTKPPQLKMSPTRLSRREPLP